MSYPKPARSRKPSAQVAKYTGPSSQSSRALAQSAVSKVAKSLAANAPVSLKADGRAFHLDEYRRASQLLKSLRADGTGRTKNNDQQQWVDALAVAMAAVFEADSRQFGVPFSPAYFVNGTK